MSGSAFEIPNLAATTLLSTAGQISTHHDFRPVRAWCPMCLASDGYDQLIWSFLGVGICVRHHIQLVAFARCGHPHRPWASGVSPANCPSCGGDLTDADETPAVVDATTAAYIQVVNWLQSGRTVTRGSLAAGLRAVLKRDGATPQQLQRLTGISRMTIDALLCGRAAPELSSITAVLARTPYCLEDLLAHGAIEPA